MGYQEAGAEARAGLTLRESCLRRAARSLVGAERVDEDGVHGRHIAGGESHPAPPQTAGDEAVEAAAIVGRGGGGGGGGTGRSEKMSGTAEEEVFAMRERERGRKIVASRPQTDG
jgi:hypothetical protein